MDPVSGLITFLPLLITVALIKSRSGDLRASLGFGRFAFFTAGFLQFIRDVIIGNIILELWSTHNASAATAVTITAGISWMILIALIGRHRDGRIFSFVVSIIHFLLTTYLVAWIAKHFPHLLPFLAMLWILSAIQGFVLLFIAFIRRRRD